MLRIAVSVVLSLCLPGILPLPTYPVDNTGSSSGGGGGSGSGVYEGPRRTDGYQAVGKGAYTSRSGGAGTGYGTSENRYDEGYSKETKYYYGGKYQGTCISDGLYYIDDTNFVICSNGYPHEQPCPPGTKTSGSPRYQAGYYYGYTDLCSVNLVDFGYGPEYYAPKGYTVAEGYGRKDGYDRKDGYERKDGYAANGRSGYGAYDKKSYANKDSDSYENKGREEYKGSYESPKKDSYEKESRLTYPDVKNNAPPKTPYSTNDHYQAKDSYPSAGSAPSLPRSNYPPTPDKKYS